MHITTNVVSSNPAYEVYSIQHYVIKFVSDLRQGRWFSPGTLFFYTDKTDRHDIAEILVKVALITITLTLSHFIYLSVLFIVLVFYCSLYYVSMPQIGSFLNNIIKKETAGMC